MIPLGSVGAGFGVEGGFDLVDVAAELFDHFFDDVVSADADFVAEELDREMAVAEVPGDPDQLGIVVGVDFEQLFRCGDDAHDRAVLAHQPVAVTKSCDVWQIEHQVVFTDGAKQDAAAMAAVEVELNLIDFRPAPLAGRNNRDRAHQNRK